MVYLKKQPVLYTPFKCGWIPDYALVGSGMTKGDPGVYLIPIIPSSLLNTVLAISAEVSFLALDLALSPSRLV